MARASPILTNFTGGEFSPRLAGRVDFRKYFDACKTLENMLIHPHGGASRRPGTCFVAEVKYPAKDTRVIPFEFSTEQAYILEIGDQYLRVYKDNGAIIETAKNITGATKADPVVITSAAHGYEDGDEIYISGVGGMTELNGHRYIVANKTTDNYELNDKDGGDIDGTGFTTYTSGGTSERIYEIDTPYLEADLFELQFAQTADTMYISHPDYAPRKLTRTAHTSWALTEMDYEGPYLPKLSVADDPSYLGIESNGASGSVTLTAHASGPDRFASTDVGRLIALYGAWGWTYAEITAYTDAKTVTATILGTDITVGLHSTAHKMGYWSDDLGYPGSVTFFEQRLWWGGSTEYPQALWASKTADYENYDQSDEVVDDDALTYLIATDQVNAIRWLNAGKVLIVGTVGGEFIVKGATTSEPITPSNIQIKRETTYGSTLLLPQRAEHSVLFLQRAGRKIREFAYSYDVDGYLAADMTLLAEHITRGGIIDMAYQQTPDSILWSIRNDGVSPAMTYERTHEVIAWHRHTTEGSFESVASIPVSDHDQIWFVVNRTINETTKRYIEYMMPTDWGTDQKDCFFVDCGLTYYHSATITAATKADPVVITATAHGFEDGDTVKITGVVGMTELNGEQFTVANKTANTFELSGIDGSGYTAYVSGGLAEKMVTTVSSLDHLEGESVAILADGSPHPNCTVSSGTITLTREAAKIHVGLGYTSTLETMDLEAGSAEGTSQGKRKRTWNAVVRLYESLGCKIGPDEDNLDIIPFGPYTMDETPPLFTGDKEIAFPGGYALGAHIMITQEQPLPLTVLAIMPRVIVSDA